MRQVQNLAKMSARVATPREKENDASKGSDLKILHYHNKFWKATLAGYLIEVTNILFSENPNKSASKRARTAKRRDKKGQTISKQAQKR